jgi:hypothetical protein
MQETTHSLSPLWAELRAGLRSNREARAARRALARDLSCYTSERDLNDLDAMLARYSHEDTADIRRIIDQRRAA